MALPVPWEYEARLDLCLLQGQECPETFWVKVLETLSWQERRRGAGLNQIGIGGEGEEGISIEIEAGGGKKTDEHLTTEIGEIEEILGGGERGEGGGTIIGGRGSGSKMMAGEGEGTRGEEDKVQVGAGTGVEREGEMKKGLSMLLQEVG